MPLNYAFKALADPTRRQILHLLQKGDLTAGEIADQFKITKPSISHHLNMLKQANLVQDLRQGQNIYYSLNTTVFQELIAWFYVLTDYKNKAHENDPTGAGEEHLLPSQGEGKGEWKNGKA